jgi:hypothetical protein
MANFAHFFSFYVIWAAIPCLAIIGIIFWIKQRTKESLIFSTGIVLIALGSLTQIFSPFGRITMDEAGEILSSSGPPLSCYTGSIITSVGFIVTVVGFAAVTWRIKRRVT